MRSAQDVIDQSARMAKNAKNKMCVRKSREKKRQMIEESKIKLAHLMSDNDILKGAFESMSKELNNLKNTFTDKISSMYPENGLCVIRSAQAQLATIKHVNNNGDETLSFYLDNLANRLLTCNSFEPTSMMIDLPVMITEPTPIPIENCTPPQPVCEETKTFNVPTFLFEAKPTVSERNEKKSIQSSQCVELKQCEAVQNNDRLFEESILNDIWETIEEEWNKNEVERTAQNVETIEQALKSSVNYRTEPQENQSNQPFEPANSNFRASYNITDPKVAPIINYYPPPINSINDNNDNYSYYYLPPETTQYQTGGAQEISNGIGSVFNLADLELELNLDLEQI